MPKAKYNMTKKPQTAKKKPTSLTCLSCGKSKRISEFYVSSSVFNAATGRVQYCKECCLNLSCDHDRNIDIEKFKTVLKKIDKPFLPDTLQSAYEESNSSENKSHPIGLYFKNLNSLPQNKRLTWKDSSIESDHNLDGDTTVTNAKLAGFVPTEAIMDKWGYGYEDIEYFSFEKKWNELIGNYGQKTSFHIEGLKTYIRFRVKEELATANGEIKDAKEWGGMAKDAATAAKINVSQLSKSDISGGVDLIPQLFEAVESEVGIIPILPHLKEQPYDDVDLIIWSTVNYQRRLEDKPRIEYKDIWNFYDEMLGEHFKQKGYTHEQIEVEKKKRNNVFRDLSEIYKEPTYNEEEDA